MASMIVAGKVLAHIKSDAPADSLEKLKEHFVSSFGLGVDIETVPNAILVTVPRGEEIAWVMNLKACAVVESAEQYREQMPSPTR